jgi:zinc transport system ATP-binding protein
MRAMAAEPVIAFEDVTFSFNGVPVLEDVSLAISGREFISVVGPNGGGKTTLLKIILGLLRPSEGAVRVFGRPPQHVRQRIGYTPQQALYDPRFPVTVLDVVLMGRLEQHLGGAYSAKDKAAGLEALREMQLEDVAQSPFNALSGGQRQRVLIARALASEPDLLLLDEPTSNMDPAVGDRLLHILQDLTRRMTILMASHDLGFVSSMVSSVVCVNRKVVIHPTSDITGEVIKDMYGGDYRMIRHDHRCAEDGHRHV